MLVYITGSADQELLLRNEYLATENRILKNQIKDRLRLTDPERISLAEIGKRLGRKALTEVAQIVRPETILTWHRKLVAQKSDGSKNRSSVGRATTDPTAEKLVLQFARENRSGAHSAWMRRRPQVGWACPRRRIRPIRSRFTAGLPAPRRDFQRQKQRKPTGCPATTVHGSTMTSTRGQPDQQRRRRTHRNRSALLRLGLGTERCRTMSGWRSARFSSKSWSRDWNPENRIRRMVANKSNITGQPWLTALENQPLWPATVFSLPTRAAPGARS